MKLLGEMFSKFNTNKYNGIYVEDNVYSIISEYNKKGFNPTFGKGFKDIPKIKLYFDNTMFQNINIDLLKEIKQYFLKSHSLYDGVFLDVYFLKNDNSNKLDIAKEEFEKYIFSNWNKFISYICVNEPLTYAFLSKSNISLGIENQNTIKWDIPKKSISFLERKQLDKKIEMNLNNIFGVEYKIDMNNSKYADKKNVDSNNDLDMYNMMYNADSNNETFKVEEVLPKNTVNTIQNEMKKNSDIVKSDIVFESPLDELKLLQEDIQMQVSGNTDNTIDVNNTVKKVEEKKVEVTVAKNNVVAKNENKKNNNNIEIKVEENVGEKGNIVGRKPNDVECIANTVENLTKPDMEVIIDGTILSYEFRKIRDDLILFTCAVYDGTSTINCTKFINERYLEKAEERVSKHQKENGKFLIYGKTEDNKYQKELALKIYCIKENGFIEKKVKLDNAEVKRVELKAHTQMSQLDGIVSVKNLFKRAKQYGMRAISITDTGVVQSFPDAMNAAKDNEIKAIYGVDANLALDDVSAFSFMNDENISDTYCVLDIETTGFSFRTDKITEFGIIKYKNGEIIDTFETFVNPEMPIPKEVVEVTHITDEMVKDAPKIDEVMPKVMEFIKGTILVAHNADFDIGFIRHNAKLLGYTFDNMYIDTLRLAKQIYPELSRYRLGKIAEYLNIKVEVAHRALDDVKTLIKVFEDMIKRISAKGIIKWNEFDEKWADNKDAYKKYPTANATILVTKQVGITNLYKLISYSHIYHYYMRPRILKTLFNKYKDGLIIGSGNSNGELFSAIEGGKTEEELLEIAKYYDYLEVPTPISLKSKVELGTYKSLEDAKNIIKKIVELGEKLEKKVVAIGDVYFLDPEDKIYREILHVGQKKKNASIQPDLSFKTTEEMLEEFEFLGKDKAYEIVVTNTNIITDMIDDEIYPISKDKATPYIEGCEDTIRDITYTKAYELYGNPLPEIVEKRLKKELDSIINNGFSVMYIIAQKLVKKSNEDGYIVGSRGSVGSSLVAYMTGITEVNSLKPHYRCEKCKYSDFSDFGILNGFDLPDKTCPVCGEKLVKDGMDIPFETFLGFTGNKEPDIDLNFSDEYQSKAHKYTEEIIGDGTTFKAGTIGTIAEKTAFGYVKGYFDDKEIQKPNVEIARLAKGFEGVKKTTGQHPGGIIVVPAGRTIFEFCPIQKPADKSDSDIITTHFDYHKIDHNLLKLDILGHLDPTMIRHLQDLTGINPVKIALDDKKTMSIFSGTEALGLKPEDINSQVGTYGVPEFGTHFVREMLVDTKPTTFEELIRISGLSHGTDVWLNNAQDLVNNNIATLSEAICTRDDIMIYLISMGLPPEEAFNIMEKVRKGKGLKPEWEELMAKHNVPQWYIDSCNKIKYMFPKAHAVAYVTNAFRIAWFKVHQPVAYYTAYFSVRAGGDFDASFLIYGEDKVIEKMKELEALPKMGVKEKGVYSICEIVLEMYKRGIKFAPIDLYESDAKKFKMIDENTILPPLNSIPGLGTVAAEQIALAAKTEKEEFGSFFTREEVKDKCRIGKSTMELLDKFGTLDGIQETAQTSIFDMMGM
ncbi:MAG: PolC-type DNA polymerase III [Clostridium sp.]